MCDFKPGDEVVCVSAQIIRGPLDLVPADNWPIEGVVYRLSRVSIEKGEPHAIIVRLPNYDPVVGRDVGFRATRFRKVIRRNDSLSIEAFLTIKPGFEEPKRQPAKPKERV